MIHMDLEKVMKWLKISFAFVLLLIGIFVSSLLIQFPSTRSNFFAYLGIVPKEDKCSGTLSLSTSGSNKCLVDAKIVTEGCLGRNYQIRENSCSGGILCQDTVSYDSFQATCAWGVPSGDYRYVLCVNNKQKDSGTMRCR
jgi:hypothetical protein